MAHTASTAAFMAIMGGVFLGLSGPPRAGYAADESVKLQSVDDRKAVIATVEPVRQLLARARVGGTITSLAVREGDRVNTGDRIALIVDQKLQLQIDALQSRVEAQQANRDQAQLNFDRIQKLRASGTSSQAQFDQARTSLDVAERTLQALLTDRQVVQEQVQQGAVLAPGAGRVLRARAQSAGLGGQRGHAR